MLRGLLKGNVVNTGAALACVAVVLPRGALVLIEGRRRGAGEAGMRSASGRGPAAIALATLALASSELAAVAR